MYKERAEFYLISNALQDLPANSTTTVAIEFRKPFIKLNEHAPDANRGLDVGYGAIKTEPAMGDCPPFANAALIRHALS